MEHDTETLVGVIPTSEAHKTNGEALVFGDMQQTSGQPRYPAVYISGNARVQLGDRYHTGTHVFLASADNDQTPNTKTEKSVFEKRYTLLLASLAFLRMEARHLNISSAMPSTCGWLFGHETYCDWMDDTRLADHYGFMWIKGKPGTGKSTLMKVVLEESKRKYPSRLNVSYFFNARAPGELENSGLGLYRSVVHQLLKALPHMRQSFVNQFFSKIAEEEDSVLPWTSTELQEFLIECFRTPASLNATIFVDALDEGDQQDVRRMVGFLEDLTSHCTYSASGNIIRVCFASRHYPLITVKRGLSLVLEKEPAHADDIRRYVNSKLVMDEHVLSSALRQRIEEKSGHIFLWVVLVVPILNGMHDNGASRDDLLTHLESLPDELHELFEKVLFRDKVNISNTIRLFQWLIFAFRPLESLELYSAMTIDDIDSRADEAEPTMATIDRCILVWSRGLTEIIVHDDQRIVQFIHETVREFLLAGKGLAVLCEDLQINVVGKSHDVLRRCCQRQIEYFAYERRSWKTAGLLRNPHFLVSLLRVHPSKYAISKYAVSHVFAHAGRAQRNEISQTEFLWLFDIEKDLIFTDFLRQCRDLGWTTKQGFPKGYYRDQTLLSVLIAQMDEEVDELILYLINKKLSLHVKVPKFENLLQAACVRGNTCIVRRLLDAGANVDAVGGRYENALMAALIFGDDEMVEAVSDCKAPTSEWRLELTLRSILKQAVSWDQVERRVNLLLSRAGDARTELTKFVHRFRATRDSKDERIQFAYDFCDTKPGRNFGFLTERHVPKLRDKKIEIKQSDSNDFGHLSLSNENAQGTDLSTKPTSYHKTTILGQREDINNAFQENNLGLAEMLLTSNPDLQQSFRYTETSDGDTRDEDHIICRAARGGHLQVVQVLLRSCVESELYRESAFRAAVVAGHTEVARLLHQKSPDVATSSRERMAKDIEERLGDHSIPSKRNSIRKRLRASLSGMRRSHSQKRSPSQ